MTADFSTNGKQLRKLVAITVQELLDPEGHDEAQIVEKLSVEGFTAEQAWRAVSFVPIAFGRHYFTVTSTPVLVDEFEMRRRETGDSRLGHLSKEPIYLEAHREASRWYAQEDRESFLRLAVQSAELDAVIKLVKQGSRVEDLVLSTPVFLNIPVE